MRISLNWLSEYIDLDVGVTELCDRLTMIGLEIEAVERPGEGIDGVVVGKILSIEPHPDADRLVVCKTDVGGEEPLQIVCGATNMSVGDRVPTACIGAVLPGDFKVGKRKMRGIASQGMMCSAKELGLGEDHEGLLIMDPDQGAVGDDVRALLGLNDTVLEIEVTPNRNDWSGMLGIARELSAAYGAPVRIPDITLDEGDTPASGLSSVTVEDSTLCPRYVGRILRGVKVGPSPPWLAQRLIAVGQRPINNIVDVTNYVLLETGHPLHAFDLDRLKGQRIVVRPARKGESITVIDGTKHTLTPDALVIADAKVPIAIAGVMGGLDSEVGEETTSIFLESACFDPVSIRKTARAYNMITEASQRFQRGADIEMVRYAVDRAAALLVEVAGGELAAGVLEAYEHVRPIPEVTLRYERTGRLLGIGIPSEKQQAILTSLGFAVAGEDEESVTVEVPSWRNDVSMETDLIEEIARLNGYGAIEATLPRIQRNREIFDTEYAYLRKIRHYLVRTGLAETITWTFSCLDDVRRACLGSEYEDMVAVSNPLSERYDTMRRSLIPAMLHTVSANFRKSRSEVAAFEIGPVYLHSEGETGCAQRQHLVLALGGQAATKHWSEAHGVPVDFYDLKGQVEGLLAFLGLQATLATAEPGHLAAGEALEIQIDGKGVGHLGRVHPDALSAYEIEQDLYVAEIRLDGLIASEKPTPQYTPVPAYPASLRDLAVVVDEKVASEGVVEVAQRSGGKHLQSVRLFDIYRGDPVPEGKKSLALSLTFQSNERTLRDKDTQKACDKILKKLKTEFDAELR